MTTPSCDGCGRCCTNQPTPPMMPDEFASLPENLRAAIEAYLSGPLFNDNDPCLWLDRSTGRCLNYEHRPAICRGYPLSGPGCRAERENVGLTIEGWPVVEDPDE